MPESGTTQTQEAQKGQEEVEQSHADSRQEEIVSDFCQSSAQSWRGYHDRVGSKTQSVREKPYSRQENNVLTGDRRLHGPTKTTGEHRKAQSGKYGRQRGSGKSCSAYNDSFERELCKYAPVGAEGAKIYKSNHALKSGEDAWISLAGVNSSAMLNIRLLKGSAEIDGHMLPINVLCTFKTDKENIFVHSWTGCEFELSSSSDDVKSYVKRIKSSSMYPKLVGVDNDRVLVVDNDPMSAITLSNYLYRGVSENPVFMLNLDNRTNAGVVCLYSLNSTIPPQHPLDTLVEKKLMFWVGSNELNEDVYKKVADCIPSNARLVVYVNNAFIFMTDSMLDLCEIFDLKALITTNDRLCVNREICEKLDNVLSVPPLLSGYAPGFHKDLNCIVIKGLFKSVFLQDFRTIHYEEKPDCYYDRLPNSLLPLNFEFEKGIASHYKTETLIKNAYYALTTGGDQSLMTVWGYAYVDEFDRCHSVLPKECVKNCLWVHCMTDRTQY